MFRSTMCQCLRKLFNVGSLFTLLFAYNTFVPFSFTGESSSSSTIYYPSHVALYAVTGVKTWLSTLEIVNLSVFRMRQ